MRIMSVIYYVIDSIHDGRDWIDSYLDQKLGRDRVDALQKAILLILAAAFVFCVYQFIQDLLHNQSYERIVKAEKQYDTAGLRNDHYGGRFSYGEKNYEDSLLNFDSFLEKFPPILYTERTQGSDAKKPGQVNEAIIKVLLSLRKLNRHDEIPYRVNDFKKKFPENNVGIILDLYKNGLFSLYSERWDLLNLAQSSDEEAIKGLETEDYEAAVDRSRIASERRGLARKTFEDARASFEQLSSHNLLNYAPYSEFKGESLYFLAKSFFIEGNYTRAYQEFDKIATVEYRNYPDLQDDAMYYTAYCLKHLKIYDEAFGRYSEFMARFPGSEYVTEAYYDLGKIYAFRKEYDSARGSYASGLQRERNKSRQVEGRLKNARISYEFGNKVISEAKAIEAKTKSKEVKDHTKAAEGESKEVEDKTKEVENKIKEAETAYKDAIRIYRGLLTEYQADFFLSETLNFISELPGKSDDWNEEIDGEIMEYESFVKKHGQERKSGFQAEIGRAYYDEGIDDNKLGNDTISRDAYYEAIATYKLLLDEYPQSNRAPRTKLLIANIYNKLNEHSESIKAYTRILDDYESDYGKENELISVTIKGSPKVTDLRAFCVYEIAVAYQEMQNYEKAIEWYKKIFVGNGFTHNDSANAVDLRRDPLAPDALYDAMWALNELDRDEALKDIASTYIEGLRKNAPHLSAEAQFNFAHIKYADLKQLDGVIQPGKAALEYKEAALEFNKLSEKFDVNENGHVSGYLPDPNLRFNLIRLHGKYYEGICYEKSYNQKDIDSKSAAADAYQKVTTLFKTTFQPLIDAPNIDVPNRDYYITEATRIFEDLISRRPKHEDAAYWRYLVGEFYYVKKEFEKAIVEYQKVLKDYPKSGYIKEARDRIQEIREKLGSEEMDSSKIQNNSDSSGNTQTEKHLTSEEIAKIASRPTVLIETEGILKYESGKVVNNSIGTGSGFFVAPSQIATNYHVISPRSLRHNKDDNVDDKIFLRPLRGTARLVGTNREYAIVGYTAIDVDHDLAIIKVRSFGVDPLTLGDSDSDSVRQGTQVYPIGNPKGLVNVVSDGKISSVQWVESIRGFLSNRSRLVRDVPRNDTPHKLLMMTAPISGGSSGGPVLNNKGEVIGISVGYLGGGQNLNYAIPVNDLKVLLNRVGPPKPLSELETIY